MSDVQIRGCCCGVPFGCGGVFLLVGFLFLWKLASPEAFGMMHSGGLLAVMAASGAGLALSVRVGRGEPPRPGMWEAPDRPAGPPDPRA